MPNRMLQGIGRSDIPIQSMHAQRILVDPVINNNGSPHYYHAAANTIGVTEVDRRLAIILVRGSYRIIEVPCRAFLRRHTKQVFDVLLPV